MICVDGFRAFRGALRVFPVIPGRLPFVLYGDCLYKPEDDCWVVQPDKGFSRSFPADICETLEDFERMGGGPL